MAAKPGKKKKAPTPALNGASKNGARSAASPAAKTAPPAAKKIDRVAELFNTSRARKILQAEERVYCAAEECGSKLEKGRSYYCKKHDLWP